ncbi:MAG: HNH endonuclease [Thalassospira sp.]|uniref:HNH endonuclease n=1 Tax=Thalassospira sp. TaxID=1912094 RepID=UPI001B20AD93|nr:HNH endonuclease [Thalassospira sp.]MBO6579457.1 HNH endonuclease [Thalassospira sp.]MBO6820027.1 HNH endonuclease [Thalassospira sp.]MBO6887820.1 HNH endonuclease [Thalassospira sp.]
MATKKWTNEERYAALKLYFELEFGQFHSKNKNVIQLAEVLDRTPGSVAMKLCNFASLDPTLERAGLKNASAADRELMSRFHNQPARVIDEIERAIDRIDSQFDKLHAVTAHDQSQNGFSDADTDFNVLGRKTSTVRVRDERLNQGFFRRAVLSGYRFQCCVCKTKLVRLLEAAHIKPHNEDETYRLRPDNGLALCRNHHKAFDEGYWTLGVDLTIEVDTRLHRMAKHDSTIADLFLSHEGYKITEPFRYLPSKEMIDWHRENTFAKLEPTFGR